MLILTLSTYQEIIINTDRLLSVKKVPLPVAHLLLIWSGALRPVVESVNGIEVDTDAYRKDILRVVVGLAFTTLLLSLKMPLVANAGQTPLPVKHAGQADADQVMATVQADVRRGDLESALDTLQPFILYPERFPTLYTDYLVILVWVGRYPEAKARFESLPAAVPRRIYLLRNMAKAYFNTQAYEKAEQLYTQVLVQTPADNTALQGLIDTLVAAGRFDEALAAIDRYGHGEGPVSRELLKARLLMEQAQYGQALTWYDTLIQARPEDGQTIAKHRDDAIAGLPREKQADLIRQLQIHAGQGDSAAAQNYVLCLVLARRFQEAVEALSALQVDPDKTSAYKTYWFAWSMFKTGRYADAESLFSAISRSDGAYLPPRIGRVYCLAALSRFESAAMELNQLSRENPEPMEILFARAYLYEKQARFWEAIQVYDGILKQYPGNEAARRMRLRAFSDLGASSLAADMAGRELPRDKALQLSIRKDLGVDRLDWDESDRAVSILQNVLGESRQRSHAFDYIAALAGDDRNQEAVAEYENLEASNGDAAGQATPAWVKSIAAGSYAALGRHHRALSLYDQALAQEPGARDARLGKFYVLQDLRQWEAAGQILSCLENETPEKTTRNGRTTANPAYYELSVQRGWFLAAQDRLREADARLGALHERIPANIEVRNALAHVHLWRGWTRRAYEEFRIIDALQPDYAPSQPGKLAAMNALAQKAEARKQVRLQLAKRPGDRHLRDLQRSLTVEQRKVLRTEFAGRREDDETLDLSLRQTFSTPLSLKSRLYTYLLWRRTWRNSGNYGDPAYFRRAGIGLAHLFNAAWQVDASLSANYNDGEDMGAAARLTYTPSDAWSFALFGDSFSTDVPRRARLADIEAAYLGAEAVWRQSEWREARLGFTRSHFSDDNERTEAYAGYQQNLWVYHDWRMRLFLDLYSGWNSKGDRTDYFNPEQTWSAAVTHMAEQTVWKREQRTFLHRLYAALGSQQQKGFSSAWIGSLRYEQEHAFSFRQSLLVGIGMGRRVYDGEAVQDINADLVYEWRF